MLLRCKHCGLIWNTSALVKVSRFDFVCPDCACGERHYFIRDGWRITLGMENQDA